MPTIFELIVKGEIPCHKVWEDDRHLAFLDINPRVEGHTLVIPKHPWDEVFAMSEEAYDALWTAARTVAHHLKTRTGCERVVVVILGYEVAARAHSPHAHNELEDFPFPPVDVAAQSPARRNRSESRMDERIVMIPRPSSRSLFLVVVGLTHAFSRGWSRRTGRWVRIAAVLGDSRGLPARRLSVPGIDPGGGLRHRGVLTSIFGPCLGKTGRIGAPCLRGGSRSCSTTRSG